MSRGSYNQSLGQPSLTTDQMFPDFADLGAAITGGQHLPCSEHVAGTPKPLCTAVVLRDSARRRRQQHARGELYRQQGDTPAHAAEHCAVASSAILGLPGGSHVGNCPVLARRPFRILPFILIATGQATPAITHSMRDWNTAQTGVHDRLHVGEEH